MKNLVMTVLALAAAMMAFFPSASQAGYNLNHNQTLLRVTS